MKRSRPAWVAPALLCLLLAVIHTWPLATNPAALSLNDNGDAQLNEWIMAWVAHQLPLAPSQLFQGNIFFPARDTLAFSEPLIVPALIGAPVAWLGGSPVLVYNLMVLAGFALTALAGYALVFAWTRDRAAGLLAGSMLAFNTHTLTRLAHVQGLHLYGLALALLAAERVMTRSRARDAWWLGAWMVAMAYTSGYLLVFATIMVAVALVTRAPDWRPRAGEVLGRFALAAAASAVAILPLYLPYRRVAREQHMVRTLDSVTDFSASLPGYLAASGTLHFSTWSWRFLKDPVDSFFPGVVVIALAAYAVYRAARPTPASPEPGDPGVTRRRIVMLLAIALTGLVLSLGTRTPVYGWVYAIFPPMQGLRAAARFGNLFLLGMSALAGLGLAAMRARHAPSRARVAVAAAIVVAANLESLRAPFEYRRFDAIPRVYRLLADEPGRVVLAEVPFYPRQAAFENAEYVLNSTAHWRSLMNGYSGYTPATYATYAADFWHFPEERAIQAMRSAGVTHVMVHPARFGNEANEVVTRLSARPEFELVAIGTKGLRLYRLR